MIASAVLFVLLLGFAGILAAVRHSVASSLTDQQAALRWNGDAAAQLSCYFAKGKGDAPGRIYSIERAVDQALEAASLKAEDNARLWYYACSSEVQMYGATDRASATLAVTVFGGEYFYIHQPDLVAGAYLASGGENAGYVFLDENAAWKLFGAINVAGMNMSVNGNEYIVCGVCAVPDGTVYDEAYGEMPRAWILFDSPAAASVSEVSVYEAVLPNPISGFAADVFAKNFASGEDIVTVDNSSRFSFSSLWEGIGKRELLGVRTSPVTYPWWENIARVAEYRCMSLLLAEIILLVIAGIECLVWIILAWKPADTALRRCAVRVRDAAEEKYNDLTRPKKRRSKGD